MPGMPERGRDSAVAVMADSGTVIAFDFGTKRIGVAVGETMIRMAHPLAEVVGEETEPRFAAIAKVIAEWRPARLVVGLPLTGEGTAQDSTRRAQRFARQLEGRFGLPVSFVDERYTSVDAEAGMREAGGRKAINEKRVDSVAAQLILQQYFDEHAA
jgi:putative Holliday junction resolvase